MKYIWKHFISGKRGPFHSLGGAGWRAGVVYLSCSCHFRCWCQTDCELHADSSTGDLSLSLDTELSWDRLPGHNTHHTTRKLSQIFWNTSEDESDKFPADRYKAPQQTVFIVSQFTAAPPQPHLSTVKCLLVYEFIIAAMAVYKVYEAIKILLFFRNLDC